MKNGDIIFLRAWWYWVNRKWVYVVRFRVDPIPSCGKYRYKFRNKYKKPQHMNEEKQFYACDSNLVRKKRHPVNLPNAYNDWRRGDIKTRKSWKNKKIDKQWMKRIVG